MWGTTRFPLGFFPNANFLHTNSSIIRIKTPERHCGCLKNRYAETPASHGWGVALQQWLEIFPEKPATRDSRWKSITVCYILKSFEFLRSPAKYLGFLGAHNGRSHQLTPFEENRERSWLCLLFIKKRGPASRIRKNRLLLYGENRTSDRTRPNNFIYIGQGCSSAKGGLLKHAGASFCLHLRWEWSLSGL